MNENSNYENNQRRHRQPSSAAQKLLIVIMLAVLAVLGGFIYHAAKHPHAAEIIDQLDHGVAETTRTLPAVTETSAVSASETASASETTTDASTTSSAETTTEDVTETTTESGKFSTSFFVEFPGSFGGQYSISVVYVNTDETTEISNISIPETTSMDIELFFDQPSTYVPAEVYLTNNANGKQALAGTINLDFANDLCDQSGLDIYTALLEVQ